MSVRLLRTTPNQAWRKVSPRHRHEQANVSQATAREFFRFQVSDFFSEASLRIEIIPQHRPKERKGTDAPLATKTGDPFAIDRDGQVGRRHRDDTIIPR